MTFRPKDLPIVVQTVCDPSDPDDLRVLGASIPEAHLAALIAQERFVEVVNQDGIHLELSYDMDAETLVCERAGPDQAPAVVDLGTGARVMLAPYATLDLTFARSEASASRADYDDLIGPNIAAVLARVGWRYDGRMARVDAFAPAAAAPVRGEPAAHIVASSWAGPVQARDGARGINISYGVGVAHRGAGLGRLLAYCAVAECLAYQVLAGEPIPTFVNIQARAANAPSLAVARSLGLPACESASFTVPENGQRIDYVGFREPVDDFLARGLAYVRTRMPDYDPGSLAAARMGISADVGSELDLLGLLERSEAVEDVHSNEEWRPG